MSDYLGEGMFRTVRRGGYDRDEVEQHVNYLKSSAAEEKNKLLLVLKSKEKKINELTEQSAKKDEEIARLEAETKKLRRDIDEKYKTYIENYDTIGQLIYDAKIRSNQMIRDAEAESSRIVKNAEAERERILKAARDSAQEQLGMAQSEMDAKIQDGRRSYAAVQDEINELVTQVNQIQRKFMQSIKSIHEISDSVLEIKIDENDFDDMDDGFDTAFDEGDPGSVPSPEDESRFLEEAMAMSDE